MCSLCYNYLWHYTTVMGITKGRNTMVRALSLWLVATALLLFPIPYQSTPASVLTTTSSALVAPYLDRPSGFIRPSIAQKVFAQRQYILQLAHRHNTLKSPTTMTVNLLPS